LPVLLEDRFGLSAGARGLVLAAPAITSTAAALMVGRLRAGHGGRRLVLFGSLAFAIAFVVIGWAPALWIVLLGGLLYGLGEGVTIPTYQDFVAGSAPPASRGAVVAVWVGAARAGQVAGPLVAGTALTLIAPGAVFVVGGVLAGAMYVTQLAARATPDAAAPGSVGGAPGTGT
jgi:MFS family permease